MQDNHNFQDPEFNGEFLDRAWDNMSAMLDREMPVMAEVVQEEGWKRYLLLFLSLGFGVFIGASMVLFWPSVDEVAPTDVLEKNPIFAENESNSLQPVVSNGSGELPPDQPASIYQHANKSNPQLIASLPGKQARAQQHLTNQKSTAYTLTSTFTSPSASSLATRTPAPQQEMVIPINRSPLATFAQLCQEEPGQLASDGYSLPATNLVKPKNRFEKENPSLGISVGMLTENYNEIDGFEAGLRAELPLNERFSVQTGAFYRTITKNKRADYAGSLDEPGLPDNQRLEASSFPVYSMQYAAVPVALNYKLTKKVNVSAGVDVAYLTRARIGDNPIGFLDNDPDETIANDLPAYLEQGMRRWEVSASVGVSYQPSDRIILDARYNYGMTDFTKNNVYGIQASNNHRYLKVGLNYLFTNRS